MLCLIAWIALPAPGVAQERPTTRQLKTLSPGAANRIVQRDLLSVLEPSGEIDSGMSTWLRGVDLVTRPFGTEFEGLCRRDAVTLRYIGAETGKTPADWPVRPYSIEAHPLFHIVRLPKIEKDSGRPHRPVVDQPVCANVAKPWSARGTNEDDEPASWFTAQDAFHAVQAGFLTDMAINAVRAGTLEPEPCPDSSFPEKGNCKEQILAAGALTDIDSAESCPAEAGAICYKIAFDGGTELTIVARGNDESPLPNSIVSIAVQIFITVT
jgi:hypothetical protein